MNLACLVDGEISQFISADDRGLTYGDGLFETLVVQRGAPRMWQLHMDRLATGCQRLGIPNTPQAVLLREVQTVAAGESLCVVKIIITRGSGGRGYGLPGDQAPRRIVTAHSIPGNIDAVATHGVALRGCKIRLAFQPALAGIKHLNRLEQVLAAREMADHPDQEGLLFDQDGFVNSALSGNLFLVSENRLLTPRMDRCGVHGVTRAAILRDFKARVDLRRVHPNLLGEAEEVFMTNAVRGIVPVTGIDGHRWDPGPVTRDMQEWFKEMASTK